jgi:ABC-type glycerol-3-phosphate transport system substrate-binding protein
MTVFASALPQKSAIQALADQFVKNTPGVARIEIQGGFDPFEAATRKYDCFYLPYSAVPNASLDTILNLDPFMTADKNLNPGDTIGGVMGAVTRDNKTWALPIGITPTVMWYDPAAFAAAHIPYPTFGWDVSAFKDALRALKPTIKGDQAPFIMPGPGGEGISLLMLIAAYGGQPIDWTTNPPTVKYTDPVNAAAMQQVLDLAKLGLIDYRPLGRDFGMTIAANQPGSPLYSDQLSGLNFARLFGKNPVEAAPNGKFTAVTFPRGSQYQALSYSVGTLYISAKAQNPDACYGWISTLAAHPDLLNLMPARQSQLDDPNLASQFGESLAAVYREVGKILADPTTLKVPSLFDGGSDISGFVVEYWLFQAWDSYILKGADLNAALTDAQTYASAYTACTAKLPAYDPAGQKYLDYLRGLIGCAAKADGRIKAFLGN